MNTKIDNLKEFAKRNKEWIQIAIMGFAILVCLVCIILMVCSIRNGQKPYYATSPIQILWLKHIRI